MAYKIAHKSIVRFAMVGVHSCAPTVVGTLGALVDSTFIARVSPKAVDLQLRLGAVDFPWNIRGNPL
ncbi:MAG: hypothetical protein KKG33_03895 [candidate division Zixibacteria bacterium]|nr:hypothetical protein [candidate division Zixibacteria bacterium]MBU1470131.1 hypothetical protein [candidate division Zixibacteria bacterium]MBU2624688.1 hypothetical protein [candidate division Zixibacteria bacterium]